MQAQWLGAQWQQTTSGAALRSFSRRRHTAVTTILALNLDKFKVRIMKLLFGPDRATRRVNPDRS
jgi:hypothetical protein